MFPSFNPGHVGIKVGLEDGIPMAKRHGFAGFDFGMLDAEAWVNARSAQALADLFGAHDIRIGCWNLPFRVMGDEADYQKGLTALPAQAKLAQTIGALRTAMWIIPSSDTLTFRENFDLHVARYRGIVRVLDDFGIRLGLEFIGPKKSRGGKHVFVHDLPGMLELCSAIAPGVGLLLDSWHWYTSGGTLDQLASLTNDQLVHIHINDAPAGLARDEQIDNQRKLPGATGVIDIQGFLRSLAKARYDGPITAEPFDKTINALPAEEAARENARAVLDVLKNL
jgi:sugar phosphate isomerase/epimerase